LTEAQRNAWASFGAQMVRTDSLGQTYTLTGAQAFTSVNQTKAALGLASIVIPPLYSNPPSITSLSGTYDLTGPLCELTFTPDPLPAGQYAIIEATPAVSAGISFQPRSKFKQIAIVEPADTSPVDITAAYTAIYGPVVAGSKIFVRVKSVGEAWVQAPPLETSVIVVP